MREEPLTDTSDEPQFAFAVDRLYPSRAALSVSGELDLAAAEQLADLLLASEVAGRTFVRLDLSGVTFMDCSCLGVVVAAHFRLRSMHGQLTLSPVSAPVSRLIKITRLDQTLVTTDASKGPVGVVPDPPPRLRPVPDFVPRGATTCSIKHARVVELQSYRAMRSASRASR